VPATELELRLRGSPFGRRSGHPRSPAQPLELHPGAAFRAPRRSPGRRVASATPIVRYATTAPRPPPSCHTPWRGARPIRACGAGACGRRTAPASVPPGAVPWSEPLAALAAGEGSMPSSCPRNLGFRKTALRASRATFARSARTCEAARTEGVVGAPARRLRGLRCRDSWGRRIDALLTKGGALPRAQGATTVGRFQKD